MIKFLFNQKVKKIATLEPDMSVLDWLRTKAEHRGTKEGCGTGDCGACTVVIGERVHQSIRYRTVNACLMMVGHLHNKHLITVEALTTSKQLTPETLHPVQRAMVECHGSQCGFCTPGFVLSLFVLYLNHAEYPGDKQVITALGGNLCRCTGYQPILAAGKKIFDFPRVQFALQEAADEFFNQTDNTGGSLQWQQRTFHTPHTLSELFAIRQQHPDAKLIAGGTDLSLEFSQQLKQYPTLISLTQVSELMHTHITETGCMIGAATPYEDFIEPLTALYPEAHEMFHRLGSQQIRNVGTLGGSLGNASPIGDPAPLLIALRAEVLLAAPTHERRVPVDKFFIAYRNTVLRDDEVIVAIHIPPRRTGQQLACYKISKRIEDDISAVLFAISFELTDGIMRQVKTGFGGMAATPKSAPELEQFLENKPFSLETLQQAGRVLEHDFNPMSDVRASRHYRLEVCKNLLQRLWYEQQNVEARVSHAAL